MDRRSTRGAGEVVATRLSDRAAAVLRHHTASPSRRLRDERSRFRCAAGAQADDDDRLASQNGRRKNGPPDDRPVLSEYWGLRATPDEDALRRQPARELVRRNADHIIETAQKYGIDAVTLGTVVYSERRHRNAADDIDEFFRDPRGSTIGVGQMTRTAFHDLVKQNRLELTPDEKKEYARDREGFAFKYLTEEKTGIEATAALIRANMDRQFAWKKYDSPITNDGNPYTLNLREFIHGAGLYSTSGLNYPYDSKKTPNPSPDKTEFDRLGPTTDHIDLKNNDVSGLGSLNRGQSLVNTFRYLPDVFEALYDGRRPHQNLGDYFTDTHIIRPGTKRSSLEGDDSAVASLPQADAGSTRNAPAGSGLQTQANAAATDNGLTREQFENIASKLRAQAPGMDDATVARTTLDLIPKMQDSALARTADPDVAVNAQGRVFVYDAGKPYAPAVFSDPQTLDADSVARNAAKVREIAQAQPPAGDAQQTVQAATAGVEPRSRGLG